MFALMLSSVLFGLFLAFRAAKHQLKAAQPGITNWLEGQRLAIGKQVTTAITDFAENLDVGEIVGQLGGGEGGANPLGAIGGLLGGGKGGIGELIGLLSQMGGGQTGQTPATKNPFLK